MPEVDKSLESLRYAVNQCLKVTSESGFLLLTVVDDDVRVF